MFARFIESSVPAVRAVTVSELPTTPIIAKRAVRIADGGVVLVLSKRGRLYLSGASRSWYASTINSRGSVASAPLLSALVRLGVISQDDADAHLREQRQAERAELERSWRKHVHDGCRYFGIRLSGIQLRKLEQSHDAGEKEGGGR